MKMENRRSFNQEGKEARNFYHLSQDDHEEIMQKSYFKKPPVNLRPRSIQSSAQTKNGKSVPRVRSASTGRDKRSELQARYWAFLFGNLQRSVNEIYQTVECYENLPSCLEAILVLENYIRDFKALAEWFKVSWDYEATPLPQRPQSLAWEVRKSNAVPRVRNKQLSSPGVSGKSSPSFSGKNSPCSTIDEANKNSPKKHFSSTESLNKLKCGSKFNVKEFLKQSNVESGPLEIMIPPKNFEHEVAPLTPHSISDSNYILKLDQYTQTNLEDENLTLAEYLEKHREKPVEKEPISEPNVSINAEDTVKPDVKEETSEKELPKKTVAIPKYAAVVASQVKTIAKAAPNIKISAPIKNIPFRNVKAPIPATNIVRKSATVSHLTQNPTRTINLPIKSATVSNIGAVNANKKIPINSNIKNKVVPPNLTTRMSARSKTMIEINNHHNFQKNQPASRISFSRKVSREDIDSSTSTLKASTDRLGSRNSLYEAAKQRNDQGSRRSEPKTMPSDNNDDGWCTVKTKRRSSLHWATRFNQPSGYASLPTLSLLNEVPNPEEIEKKEEVKEEPKKKMGKSPEPGQVKQKITNNSTATKNPSPKAIVSPTKKAIAPVESKRQTSDVPLANKAGNNNVNRQNSDVTGLKMKTLHKEFLRREKLKDNQKPPSPPPSPIDHHPSLLSDNEDYLFNKVDMNIQTNLVSSTIENLYTKCLNSEKSRSSDINLSSCEEFEEREDIESDEDQRKLLEEQESLERQIRELQNTGSPLLIQQSSSSTTSSEIDIDTETDETDCEAIIDLEDNESSAENIGNISENGFIDEEMTLEMRYESVLSDMTWVERAETLATLQALVARHPGRAQQLHAKLSSPSRRRSLHETLKKYQAKQTRALEKRQALQREKASKIQHLLARVEDVKAAKQQLIEKKRMRMEERLHRAAVNRTQYLKHKIKKAHDEEEKLKEIAFIKNIETQNKLLDYYESCKEQEGRLQYLEQEKQKRAEEKAAKEAAVERRRLEIELERQKRLEKMSENRREREKRVGKMQEQKEKMRQALAREKARDREERLQALQAQQLATTEELQRKIIQKQQESARRHEENIEHIRQRAVELTIPNRNADENALKSANEHDHEDDNLSVSDKGKEITFKVNKKKLKKLRQRMCQNAEQYLAEMQPLAPQIRKQSQVPKLLNTIVKGGGPLGVERPLGQLLRLIAKAEVVDFQSMWLLDGLKTISDIIQKGMEPNSDISKRAIVISVQLYRNACSLCPQISRHAILGNTLVVLLDALVISLKTPEEKSPLYPVELSTELILACTVALSPTNSLKQTHPKVMERLPDLISYTVSLGLIEFLVRKYSKLAESVENQQSLVLSLLASLGLLTKLAELCPKGVQDTTKFLSTVKSTELFGTISLLYSTIVPIGECIPPRTISLAAASFNLLVTLANLDINTFQEVLSEEYLSLKFLDVISILLQYCGPKSEGKGETQAVIVDLVATLGFFCANNKNNQDLITSEQSFTIIKCLTRLPKKFDVVIYPTLVTIIYENPDAKMILSKDFDVESLEEYKKSDMAKKNRIVSLLKE